MNPLKVIGWCCLLSIQMMALSFANDEPSLSIQSGVVSKKFTRSQLLKDAKTIEVSDDPAYPGHKNKYLAVEIKSIFKGLVLASDSTLLFKCIDGFSAPISRERLLNYSEDGSIPFIAIESPSQPWPKLKNKKVSAGPFYLVWMNSKKSKIGTEEWPYQLAGFEIKASIASEFPGIIPDSKLSETHEVRKGFQVFTKNCFACHTMNGEGYSQIGPDLNLPENPTEYFKEGYLQKLIRNPQNLRHWPQSKMKGFTETEISNSEMNDLVAYLKHMSGRKK